MRVSIDIDGVLADFSAGAYPIMSEVLAERGIDIGPYPPTAWNWSDYGATELDVHEMWDRIKATKNWYEGLNALQGIIDLRKALWCGVFHQHDSIFLTSRVSTKGRSAIKQTENWLKAMLGLQRPEVIAVGHNGLKSHCLETLQAYAHIDDYPPTAICTAAVCQSYLLQQPWNEVDIRRYSINSVSSVEKYLRAIGIWVGQ